MLTELKYLNIQKKARIHEAAAAEVVYALFNLIKTRISFIESYQQRLMDSILNKNPFIFCDIVQVFLQFMGNTKMATKFV